MATNRIDEQEVSALALHTPSGFVRLCEYEDAANGACRTSLAFRISCRYPAYLSSRQSLWQVRS